jgi:two-component system cell cycle sensor histidine kinase PleC
LPLQRTGRVPSLLENLGFEPSGLADDSRLRQARLQIVADSLLATVIFNPLFALTGAVIVTLPGSLFGPVAAWRLATAFGAQVLSASLAFLLYRRFRLMAPEDVARAQRLLMGGQVLFSAVWGLVTFLYWVPGNEFNHLYIAMMMALVGLSVVFARSAHIPIMAAGVGTQFLFYGLRLATTHGAIVHFAGLMVPVYLAYLCAMGRASHQRIEAMIASRFASADMAEALAKARDEALRKRFEAETANASKTAFLANMSHELRTPLNAILGFSDIIAHQAMGPGQADRYSDYARDIHASGAHLLSLINDLLDVAKIEAGKMEIDRRMTELRPLVDGTVRLIAPRAAGRGQTLSVSFAADTPSVPTDERAFRQMLLNLLSNAVKFTPAGGRIALDCGRAADGGLELCVRDNGPGIAPDKLTHVFEPFSQIDNRFDREAGGTGLGLALVRGLARLHGGRAWLESEVGAGVRAYIYLPATFATPAERVRA